MGTLAWGIRVGLLEAGTLKPRLEGRKGVCKKNRQKKKKKEEEQTGWGFQEVQRPRSLRKQDVFREPGEGWGVEVPGALLATCSVTHSVLCPLYFEHSLGLTPRFLQP